MDTMARWDLTVRRNDDAWSVPLRVVGLDLTNSALHAQVRLAADTGGVPLLDLPGKGPNDSATATSVRFVSVAIANGVPTSVLAIQIAKTERQALPYQGDAGDPSILAWGLTIGGVTRAEGRLIVPAQVVGSDEAPARLPATNSTSAGGFASGATLTVAQDGGATLVIDGAGLLAGMVAQAQAALQATQTALAQAQSIRDQLAAQLGNVLTIG